MGSGCSRPGWKAGSGMLSLSTNDDSNILIFVTFTPYCLKTGTWLWGVRDYCRTNSRGQGLVLFFFQLVICSNEWQSRIKTKQAAQVLGISQSTDIQPTIRLIYCVNSCKSVLKQSEECPVPVARSNAILWFIESGPALCSIVGEPVWPNSDGGTTILGEL